MPHLRVKSARLCLGLAVSVLLAAARVSTAPERGAGRYSSALAEGFEALEIRPELVTASLESPVKSEAGPGKSVPPGLALCRQNLARVLDWLECQEKSLGAMEEAGDFLAWAFGQTGQAVQDKPGQSTTAANDLDQGLGQVSGALDEVIPGAGEALAELLAARTLVDSSYRNLDSLELVELTGLLSGFAPADDQWPHYPVERMILLASRIDLALLGEAALKVSRASSRIRAALKNIDNADSKTAVLSTRGPVLLQAETPWGAVVVGSAGDNLYTTAPLLLIDLGGDDRYEIRGKVPRLSLIIDRGGDDRYSAPDGYALGGALLGLSWLEDLGGDDRYQGGAVCLGAAAGGLGVLIDRGGDDSYSGTSLCQGAALFGIGLILDTCGRDRYEVGFCGQGACVGFGAGLAVDLGGDDSYFAGGLYRDWREKEATKSFAQGASAGLRPFAPGGLAVLYDRAGDDRYRVDYLGQGAGYWGGAGLLVDCEGGDFYEGGRYAQGCGLHLAAGLLADLSGNDSYTLRGVGQGSGQDRALGILAESGGNDLYRSGWMARGAADAAGVGLLLELGGDDRYFTAESASDGFGSRHRELGSLGILIDCQGEDIHGESRDENEIIRRTGTWGAAADLPVRKSGR